MRPAASAPAVTARPELPDGTRLRPHGSSCVSEPLHRSTRRSTAARSTGLLRAPSTWCSPRRLSAAPESQLGRPETAAYRIPPLPGTRLCETAPSEPRATAADNGFVTPAADEVVLDSPLFAGILRTGSGPDQHRRAGRRECEQAADRPVGQPDAAVRDRATDRGGIVGAVQRDRPVLRPAGARRRGW